MRFSISGIVAMLFIAIGTSGALAVGMDKVARTKSTRSYTFDPCRDAQIIYHEIDTGYHHNQQWPWPFFCPDRVAVREPFAMMVDNGWRRQNLLGEHHFAPESDKLTTAGELKIRWIVNQAPPERRSIFVERALDPADTELRLSIVRDYAARASFDGQEPPVAATHLESEGRPAGTVDWVYVRFQENMPAPVLPAKSSTNFSQ